MDAPVRRTPKPKLRSSCDGCGAAKVKCDRGQPACSRCRSLGVTCVYGVARPMGKPPQDKRRMNETASHNQKASIDNSRLRKSTYGSGSSGFGEFAMTNQPISMPEDHSSLHTSLGGSDALHAGLLAPAPTDLPSMEFNADLLNLNAGDMSWSRIESGSPPASYSFNNYEMSFETVSSPESKSHDCCRDAYATLSGLAFLDLDKAGYMPLDHVLRLNREAIERLSHILVCACAKRPHVALLCASIIARALILYQQAAGNNFNSNAGSCRDAVSQFLGSSASINGSISPRTQNSTAANTPRSTTSQQMTLGSIGSFSVDDQQVQSGMRIQLLLGEVKRVSGLIDLFASHSAGSIDEYTFNPGDALHKSLSLWLRREHSRVVDVTRSKLLEASH